MNLKFDPVNKSEIDESQFIGEAFEHDGKWWRWVSRGTDVAMNQNVVAAHYKDVVHHYGELCGVHSSGKWVVQTGKDTANIFKRIAIRVPAPAKQTRKLTVSEVESLLKEAGHVKADEVLVIGVNLGE